ncbi:MAG: hypothetical protein MI923_25130 [Phycisphaerales bacterium]|nr:hypothetical protein [Phycisphaerales bacterium]
MDSPLRIRVICAARKTATKTGQNKNDEPSLHIGLLNWAPSRFPDYVSTKELIPAEIVDIFLGFVLLAQKQRLLDSI